MTQSSFSLAANCTQILTTEGSDRMPADCIVVVPALNEEKYISRCIESLLHQSISEFPVIVADGGSTDRTRDIVTDITKREPRVQFIKIPGSQACAVNAVARQTGEGVKWLVRADAHAVYPAHFVEALIAAARQTHANTVVVPMRTVGHGCFQRAAAAAQNSRLGNGGALHRRGKSSRFVDHGHHALFELEHFRRVGGYDETSSGNEDFELDHRSRKAGGTVWLASEASIDYISRDSLWALARQYFRHGHGRAQTIVKHTIIRRTLFPKVRQILPVVVLGLYVVGIGLSPWIPMSMLLPAGHLMTCLFWGAFLGLRERDLCSAASGICAAVMHLAWAIGLCAGLARHIKTHRAEIPLLARLRLSK